MKRIIKTFFNQNMLTLYLVNLLFADMAIFVMFLLVKAAIFE